MKKHKIVVADSSYTIRRILELSFEDEEEIEIHTFESGEGLTDKLAELLPSVVITDIKLPFKSGYDICAFINQNDQLEETKVFLMRGGFEAVDDDKLASLKYQEIISKPFDSTEVIEKIKECLFPAEKELKAEPGAAPDDIPEIDDIDEESSDDISFSDVKDEIDEQGVEPEPAAKSQADPALMDVEPSEERTQDSAYNDKDGLLADEQKEEMANPFKEGEEGSGVDIDDGDFGFSTEEKNLEITSDGDDTDEFERQRKAMKKAKQAEMAEPTDESPSGEEDSEFDQEDMGFDEEEIDLGEAEPLAQEDQPVEKDSREPESDEPGDLPSVAQNELDDLAREPTKESVTGESETDEEEETKDTESPRKNTLDEADFPEVPVPPEDKIQRDLDSLREQKAPAKVNKEKASSLDELGIDKNVMIDKLENKLELSIREILWEVIPTMAEKIINREINDIKSKIEEQTKE